MMLGECGERTSGIVGEFQKNAESAASGKDGGRMSVALWENVVSVPSVF